MHPLLSNYFNFIHKFTSPIKESSSVGLDIGTSECKLIEISKSNDSFELLSWAVDPVLDGNVAATLQKMLSRLKIPCKAPYTSIFGKGTLIRYIDMPRMSKDELKNSFGIESDKYFPFPQDKIYTDCYILDAQAAGQQMSVMAAAVKREIVDQRIKLLSDLGAQADFIGLDSIALANVINVLGCKEEADKNTGMALLDMGDTVSNLTIFVDRLPRFSRDIYIGGRDFTKSISNALGVGFADAEKLKINPGERLKDVAIAYESVIGNIVQELKLSFDYFVTERNKEIQTLLLTGGCSLLTGVSDTLKSNLEIKVQAWDPFSNIKINPELSGVEIHKNAAKLSVALGLALYDYD